jgi:hypothetical protein
MKKMYFIAMLFATIQTQAQVYFFDDFESQSLEGYTLYNLDGLTPDDPGLATMADSAWTVRFISSQGWEYGYSAFSVSWYVNDEGPSDDWLVTPAIEIGEEATLSWSAMAITSSGVFRDRYQVFVANSPDLAAFGAAAPLFDTGSEGEEPTPQERSLDLTAAGFANETIYIAFRNWTQPYQPGSPGGNGNGGNELCIDNVKVEGSATSVNEVNTRIGKVELFPNPVFDGTVNLALELKENENLSVRLVDMTGRTLFEETKGNLPAGEHRWEKNFSHLKPGKYFVQITGNHGVVVKELIIM